MHQHVEAHVFFALIVVLFLDDFLLEALMVGDLRVANRTLLLPDFGLIAAVIVGTFLLLLSLTGLFILVPPAITAFEVGATFDLAQFVPFLTRVTQVRIALATLRTHSGQAAPGSSAVAKGHLGLLVRGAAFATSRRDDRSFIKLRLVLRLHTAVAP